MVFFESTTGGRRSPHVDLPGQASQSARTDPMDPAKVRDLAVGPARHDGRRPRGADSRQYLEITRVFTIQIEREAPEQALRPPFGRRRFGALVRARVGHRAHQQEQR